MESKDIKPSITRVKVLNYLIQKKTHPTVDEIYQNLVTEIPTLSKTTVYNSMQLFIDANLVRILNVGDNESRYDADVSEHGHFKCISCERVYDFSLDYNKLDMEGLEEFDVIDKNVYLRGYCPQCRNISKN